MAYRKITMDCGHEKVVHGHNPYTEMCGDCRNKMDILRDGYPESLDLAVVSSQIKMTHKRSKAVAKVTALEVVERKGRNGSYTEYYSHYGTGPHGAVSKGCYHEGVVVAKIMIDPEIKGQKSFKRFFTRAEYAHGWRNAIEEEFIRVKI